MYINNADPGSNVELHCTKPGFDTLSFKTTATLGFSTPGGEHYLYCEPIYSANGKLLNLTNCTVSINVTSKSDHRVYKYVVSSVKNVKNNKTGAPLLLLGCNTEGIVINLRRAQRHDYSAEGLVHFPGRIGDNQCTIHDISATGIAVIIPSLKCPNVGATMVITFTAKEFGETFTVQARVARLQEVSASTTLCGCDFTQYYANIVTLCNYLKTQQKKKAGTKK